MKKIRIVLADDMKELHNDVRHTLDSTGFSYEIVEDFYKTSDLLDYLFDNEDDIEDMVDMLILDHDFSGNGKNGLDILQELREYAPKLPVLMLTTFFGPNFEMARKVYGIDYIQKPVKASDLSFRIGAIIDTQEIKNERDSLKQQLEKWESFSRSFKDKGIDIDLDKPENAKIISDIVKGVVNGAKTDNQIEFLKQVEKYRSMYTNFTDDIIEYLASGEVFFNKYKNESSMDMAPVGLNYFRALEGILKLIIQKKNIATQEYNKRKGTIGASIIILQNLIAQKYGQLTLKHLHKLLSLRNQKIAHYGAKFKYGDLMSARELMLGDNGHLSLFSCLNEMVIA